MTKFNILLNQPIPKENLINLLRKAVDANISSDFRVSPHQVGSENVLYKPDRKYGVSRVGVDLDEDRGCTVMLWVDPDEHRDGYDTYGILSELKGKTTHVDRFVIIIRGRGMVPMGLRVDLVSIRDRDVWLDSTLMGRFQGSKHFIDTYLN